MPGLRAIRNLDDGHVDWETLAPVCSRNQIRSGIDVNVDLRTSNLWRYESITSATLHKRANGSGKYRTESLERRSAREKALSGFSPGVAMVQTTQSRK